MVAQATSTEEALATAEDNQQHKVTLFMNLQDSHSAVDVSWPGPLDAEARDESLKQACEDHCGLHNYPP